MKALTSERICVNRETYDLLVRETARFYQLNAASFSATRKAPWAGWNRLFEGSAADFAGTSDAAQTSDVVRTDFASAPDVTQSRDATQASDALRTNLASALDAAQLPVRVLDVACGNLRFERFLQERFPNRTLRMDALDNCVALANDLPQGVTFHECDVLQALVEGTLSDWLPGARYQLVASFGFMHHVPGHANRVRLLRELCSRVAPGGFAAFSFWQFMKEPGLATRAKESTAQAIEALGVKGLRADELESGDYLLGWQGGHEAFRYCHSFDDAEIDALVSDAGLASRVVDRFEADGRTGNLNAYLVIAG